MGKLKCKFSGPVSVVFHRQPGQQSVSSSSSPSERQVSSQEVSLTSSSKKKEMYVNLDQIQWKYRAEGNANLVLAMPATRQVLRLKKVDLVEVPGTTRGDANENFQFLKSVVDYIKDISSLFLLDDYVIDPQLMILMLKDMEAFNKQLNQYRPVERLTKGIRFPFGIIYPDVTFLPPYLTTAIEPEPMFCVEIKPKQGWRFDGSPGDIEQFQKLFQLDDSSLLAKCRYCAMQHLKYKKGKIHSLSNYCPLDLFSGDIPKMSKAIKNLIACPQNNLRIFRNGVQVYGDQQYHNSDRLHNILEEICDTKDRQRNLHHFTQLLCNILLKEYSMVNGCGGGLQRRMESNLPVNCVLQQILSVQRLVYDFFRTLKLNEKGLSASGEERSGNENEEEEVNCDSIRNRIRNELLSGCFKKYQFGATALDCSLMITFQRITSETTESAIDEALARKFIVTQKDGSRFMTKIAIMDLDPKPFTHATKYIAQTRASYQTQSCQRGAIVL